MHQEHNAAEPGANQDENTDFRRAEQTPLSASSFRDDGPMWLYDEPYGPYVPRSIFRKKPEPVQDPPPAAAAAPEPPCCRQTEARLQEKFNGFVDAIIRALAPYRDAYQAFRDVIATFAAEEQRERSQLGPQPRAA